MRRNGCPKGCFWRVRFFSAPLWFFQDLSGVLRANLKGAEKKRTLQKHPFGQPFLRTAPSPLLWARPDICLWDVEGSLILVSFFHAAILKILRRSDLLSP